MLWMKLETFLRFAHWNLSKKLKEKILKLFISSNPDVDFLRFKILKLKCYLKLCGNTKENSNLRFPSSNITALTRRVKTPFLAYLVLLFHIGHMGIDYNILELTSYFTNRIHKNLKRGWFFDVSKLYVSRWKSYYFYFITKIWSRMWHPSDKQFYRKKISWLGSERHQACKLNQNTVPTHNSDIFVRPKKCQYFG